MKKLLATTGALGLALLSTSAHAEFGNEGDVSFSADRLMGFWIHGEGNYDATGIGLGAAPGLGRYSWARFGVDGIIVDHLSLGGNLAFWHNGGDRDETAFLVYPRIGYVVQISDAFGFWPRGGITFSHYDGFGDDDEVALSFEAMFYASPIEHFAFTFGPSIDIGLAGDGPESRSFGIISAGLMGWL